MQVRSKSRFVLTGMDEDDMVAWVAYDKFPLIYLIFCGFCSS